MTTADPEWTFLITILFCLSKALQFKGNQPSNSLTIMGHGRFVLSSYCVALLFNWFFLHEQDRNASEASQHLFSATPWAFYSCLTSQTRDPFSRFRAGLSSWKFMHIVIIPTLFYAATNLTWITWGWWTANAPRIWPRNSMYRTLKRALTQVKHEAASENFQGRDNNQPLSTGENVAKAVEMLLERVMLRMDTLSLPGRMLPITMPPVVNGHDDRIRLENASEKTKCNCWRPYPLALHDVLIKLYLAQVISMLIINEMWQIIFPTRLVNETY